MGFLVQDIIASSRRVRIEDYRLLATTEQDSGRKAARKLRHSSSAPEAGQHNPCLASEFSVLSEVLMNRHFVHNMISDRQ